MRSVEANMSVSEVGFVSITEENVIYPRARLELVVDEVRASEESSRRMAKSNGVAELDRKFRFEYLPMMS
jgi:hypothetical protein